MAWNRLNRMGLLVVLALGAWAFAPLHAGEEEEARKARSAKAHTLFQQGNFKEAFAIYEPLCLDPGVVDPKSDLSLAVQCLQRLNQLKRFDPFIQKVTEVHAGQWRWQADAARQYSRIPHHGYMVAGAFERGHHRGGGQMVNAWERDRVVAMGLYKKSIDLSRADADTAAVARIHMEFADWLLSYRGGGMAWKLQEKTDLDELPDYEPGYGYHGGRNQGAPVDAEGKPLLYKLPKSWEAATNDGERWRWLLWETMEIDPKLKAQALFKFATFLQQQFGVQTMRHYGRFPFRQTEQVAEDGETKDEAGPYEVHTLKDNETIARLATGIKRFTLPDEFAFVKIYNDLADEYGRQTYAPRTLAQIFENRRQYKRAVGFWRRSGVRNKQQRIDQILKNWGSFEPVQDQPAGTGAEVQFRFRNGKKVTFTAHRLDVPRLLADVKAYIKSDPRSMNWWQYNLGNLGYRIVQQNQKQYIKEQVAQWSMDLEPDPRHFNRRVTVATPLQKAGAYLVVGQMEDGNSSRVIIWLNDLAIVHKRLGDKKGGQAYYFVADAVTGAPVAKANLAFFGWRRRHRNNRQVTTTDEFAEYTDATGQAIIPGAKLQTNDNFQWLVTASTEDGGLAYMGFERYWFGRIHDETYHAKKVFGITDRPAYRPDQTVKFSAWIRNAQYDMADESRFAGQTFFVRIHDAKGEKVFEKALGTDDYGGLHGEYPLPADAPLGVYRMTLRQNNQSWHAVTWRVEEYKKPEFEVSVEAPTKPIALGEPFKATIQAKYYFGAPVTEATVSYKVLRHDHDARWYPAMPWDWFYEPGYWWFCYDYPWYPGWKVWGMDRPVFWWWPKRHTQPELVAQGEAPIGEDGTYKLLIDTESAKLLHPDLDHRYEIQAEVRDQSRRTIVGQGKVLVARKPFKVYLWVDKGHYTTGEVIHASIKAQTLDQKPVQGQGTLNLYRISYDAERKPIEASVYQAKLHTDDQGEAEIQIKAAQAGQYRLSYVLNDGQGHEIEGGYIVQVRGKEEDAGQFRFADIELVPEKTEYAPGETVKLAVNTNRLRGTVLLFLRPSNSMYLPPQVLRLEGRSTVVEVPITKKDMPNIFVEAVTVSGGRLFTTTREIAVPPEKRVLNVEVTSRATEYRPGETGHLLVTLTDMEGKPFVGSTVLTVYDKSLEYISGGSNVGSIKDFFWKWRRRHHPRTQSNLGRWFQNLLKQGETGMQNLGVFGDLIGDPELIGVGKPKSEAKTVRRKRDMGGPDRALGFAAGNVSADAAMPASAPMEEAEAGPMKNRAARADKDAGPEEPTGGEAGGQPPAHAEAAVRKNFADTALWSVGVVTDENGRATFEVPMPENLTTWAVRCWAMGHGTKVGAGSTDIITTKKVILRLQAPRFFVETDEVVLSANIHNYLDTEKEMQAVLQLDGPTLKALDPLVKKVTVKAGGEVRVDWRVKAIREGTAIVRMKALADVESDAMEMRFPVLVHGMEKLVAKSGVIRPEGKSASVEVTLPEKHKINATKLTVRYSPTLAGAMLESIPYLAEYPYGCTEQTLNRFLPALIARSTLKRMGVDLKALQEKTANLNAQELGDAKARMAQWQRWQLNPVFDEAEMDKMVKQGIQRLTNMQVPDGGWGWFSGYREQSYPHTTAVVVHGLQEAKATGIALVPGVLERGEAWLKTYQGKRIAYYKKEIQKGRKPAPNNLDAMVYRVLVDAGVEDAWMGDFLYEHRLKLAPYGQALIGLAYHKGQQIEKRDMVIRNLSQFLVEDDENQTAYLELGNAGWWWYWYGSEIETMAAYLQLRSAVDPKIPQVAGLVKYLLNNRKHATYWNSTRDTAMCVEAFADYLQASGEGKPDLTLTILVDGKEMKQVKITPETLFTYDDTLELVGDAVGPGTHTIEIRKTGTGPLYFNTYLEFFSLEDFIPAAGLEIKVRRNLFKLEPVEKTVAVAGSRGQLAHQKVEKYKRVPLKTGEAVESGQLLEVELILESKNDYEYLIFEDRKAAGFEPVDVRSGYNDDGLGAYMELRDTHTAFFLRRLARGKNSLSYRVRAEIPGSFSALPAKGYAMYAPELKANSDEFKVIIQDKEPAPKE